MSKKRWNERTRMLLTLQLAIILPAAAIIGFTLWNLRSIQRDKAIEAAIHRDFLYVTKIAEKKMNEKIRSQVATARQEFPCPDDHVAAGLEKVLRENPQIAFAFLYDQKTNAFIVRSRSDRADGPDYRPEISKAIDAFSKWLPVESKSMLEKFREMEKKDQPPYYIFTEVISGPEKRNIPATVALFTPPHLTGDRVAMGGIVFDPDYLRKDFFPQMLDSVLAYTSSEPSKNKNAANQAVMMIHLRKEWEPLAASSDWDGGKPEVERAFEEGFPGLVMAVKYKGTTVAAIGEKFVTYNFIILGCLSLLMAAGIWLTWRNVSREMALARLKSDFVANVSHELRTPLSLIRLYAETLELGRLTAPDKFQEYYRIIRKESERLSALINNILDFSRIEAGRKEYEFKETDIALLVHNTLESYRYQIEQNGFSFEERIAEDIPPLKVDREAIARSLLNLINNALKYSRDQKYIGVNVYRSNGSVKVEVIDKGIGIPPAEQSKIFEKFYRVGDPLVHNTKGSGLGLSLVRHIVQAHGGQVFVESNPGKGSKFVIALPIQMNRPPQADTSTSPPAA